MSLRLDKVMQEAGHGDMGQRKRPAPASLPTLALCCWACPATSVSLRFLWGTPDTLRCPSHPVGEADEGVQSVATCRD